MTAVTSAADQLHQAGADEVADAFGVAHDARQQDAGLRRIEVAHRQAHDLGLHPLAHVGDRPLRGHAEDLRQPKLVIAWTTVAAPAASAIGSSRSCRPLPITSSITHFDSAGSTMPASRLTIISVRPIEQPAAVLLEQLARFAPGGAER